MNKIWGLIIEKILPVPRHELAKFFCLAMMVFLIAYIHSMLRISKDALIISHLCTETISAIEVWLVLPASLIFMFIYIKLADLLTRAQLFHAVTWFFLAYFVFFALVCYPYREALVINIDNKILLQLPALKYLFKMISNWHYCLFYVFSEMWVVILLSISFWQTANHITTAEEAKIFYPLLGLVSQFGLMMAGLLSRFFAVDSANWQLTLNKVTVSIVIAGLALSLCLMALGKVIGVDAFNLKRNQLKDKGKTSLFESLKYISSSKTILLITSLLLCYNISINLVEGIWKKSLEVFFASNANSIHYFMSNVHICISLFSIVCAIFGIYILRICKWKTSALITPIIALITGGMFFLVMWLRDSSSLFVLKTNALAIVVYLGAAYYIFSRSIKHTLFDSAKEMVYIPLNEELKIKGKTVAETIGSKWGKGGGAIIQQLLLALFPSLTLLDLSQIISVIFLVIVFGWLFATTSLSRVIAFSKAK